MHTPVPVSLWRFDALCLCVCVGRVPAWGMLHLIGGGRQDMRGTIA